VDLVLWSLSMLGSMTNSALETQPSGRERDGFCGPRDSVRHRAAVCVVGWYFRETLYRKLAALPADVFVVSHRPRRSLPPRLLACQESIKIQCAPNFGYDWGGYQQFLASAPWKRYDFVVFMHDDVDLLRADVIERCQVALGDTPVVGNGRRASARDLPLSAPQSYAHSSWKPETPEFTHEVVRGSFFCATRKALQALGHMEVFWDPFGLTVGYGNWSTRATCGRWESVLGHGCFGFLSEQYCHSEWIGEEERGGVDAESDAQVGGAREMAISRVHTAASRHMSAYWGSGRARFRTAELLSTGLVVSLASGRSAAMHDFLRPAPAGLSA
jgi:hypothetical protein